MRAFFSGSMKPLKVLLMLKPDGGTRPTREPGGNMASSARAGAIHTSRKSRRQGMRRMRSVLYDAMRDRNRAAARHRTRHGFAAGRLYDRSAQSPAARGLA